MPRSIYTKEPVTTIAVFTTIAFLGLLLSGAFFISGLSKPQCAILGVVFLLIVASPAYAARPIDRLSRALSRLGRHRGVSFATVAGFSFAIAAVLSLFLCTPQPSIHDEFSYLLASDTFAHWRITNPAHPMWVHFDTYHVIQQPTYASKYPPGQGLVLAVGQIATGHPIVGAWLSTAIACALIYWMLLAWVPPRWAIAGGFLAVLHPVILSWSQNFWGGSVAMAGGALALGAFRRTLNQPKLATSLLLGLGISLLVNSRPFEGGILSLLLVVALLIGMFGPNRSALKSSVRLVALPLLFVISVTALGMAFYNKRVTGNVLQMPYMLHEAQYAAAPPFIWQRIKPEPVYTHKELRTFYYDYVVPIYLGHRSVVGLIANSFVKILLTAYSISWLSIPLIWFLVSPQVLRRDGWVRFELFLFALFTIGLMLDIWFWPHYTAPIFGLSFILAVQAFRYLSSRRFGGRHGKLILRSTLGLSVSLCMIFCFHLAKLEGNGWSYERARINSELATDSYLHLIIVRYTSDHDVHQEWVFNQADIDNSRVVWARDMGEERNKELIDYFKGRKVWLLEPDRDEPKLVPYSN